jgi:hypothetical protein
LPALDNPAMLTPKAYHAPALTVVPWNDPVDMDPRVKESSRLFRTSCKYDMIQVFTDSRKKIEDALNIAKNDTMVKAITGAKTVDQAFADYKKKYTELKVDRVLKEMNTGK